MKRSQEKFEVFLSSGKLHEEQCCEYMGTYNVPYYSKGGKSISIKHGLRTADCGLGIKYGLGIKRGLENMDWV